MVGAEARPQTLSLEGRQQPARTYGRDAKGEASCSGVVSNSIAGEGKIVLQLHRVEFLAQRTKYTAAADIFPRCKTQLMCKNILRSIDYITK